MIRGKPAGLDGCPGLLRKTPVSDGRVPIGGSTARVEIKNRDGGFTSLVSVLDFHTLKGMIIMQKGRILFLNGITSSGKTSIVDALQERKEPFFYVVANDLFEQMIGERFLREDYWKYLSEVIILMYHTAKLYSDMGKNVLIDGILVERAQIRPHYQQLLEILKENPLDVVEVYCPLEVCRQRNIARGDRYETQSEEQAALMAKDIHYSMRVDTSCHSPSECAEQILATLFHD